MVKKCTAFVVALLWIGLTGYAQTPRDSINIGGVSLRIGATQATVLQRLGENYDLSETQGSRPDSSSWIIMGKGTPKNAVGSVYFKNGKLYTVYKYWTLSEADTQ